MRRRMRPKGPMLPKEVVDNRFDLMPHVQPIHYVWPGVLFLVP